MPLFSPVWTKCNHNTIKHHKSPCKYTGAHLSCFRLAWCEHNLCPPTILPLFCFYSSNQYGVNHFCPLTLPLLSAHCCLYFFQISTLQRWWIIALMFLKLWFQFFESQSFVILEIAHNLPCFHFKYILQSRYSKVSVCMNRWVSELQSPNESKHFSLPYGSSRNKESNSLFFLNPEHLLMTWIHYQNNKCISH